ncbi:hypothetical protein B0T14DRAFT_559840 [Immersiella caudata]|uniref:Uncharacterized protein n=1 Tax=Immersiella caudata TaxID=314043 RepID=A0AA40CB01_9PEZI|nr:hypothetical protein B0T14DRAFT_559840 [Immersiella caudata]
MDKESPSVPTNPLRPPSRARGGAVGHHPRPLHSPPPHIELYEKKPLPPIPAKREPATDRLSEDINKLFSTAVGSNGPETEGLASGQIDWAKEEANIAVILDNRIRRNISPAPASSTFPGARKRSKQNMRMRSGEDGISSVLDDAVAAPPPKSSMRKIVSLTGGKLKGTSLPSPSGHNSSHKIKQLTGTEVGSEQTGVEGSTEASPMSRNSSIYSAEDFSDAGSLDTSSSYDMGYASDPNTSSSRQPTDSKKAMFGALPPVPSPLNITKIQEAKRINLGGHRSSFSTNDAGRARDVNNEFWLSDHPTGRYHMTTAQIARSVPGTPLRPPRPLKARQTLFLHPQSSYPELLMMNKAAALTANSLPPHGNPTTSPPLPRSPPPAENGSPTDPKHWRYLLHSPNLYQDPSPPPVPPKPKLSPTLNDGKFPRSHHRSILSKVFRRSSGLPSQPTHGKTLSSPNIGSTPVPSSTSTLLPAAEITPTPPARPGTSHRYTQSAPASASTTNIPIPPIPSATTPPPRPRTAAPELPQSQPNTLSAWDHDDDTERTGLFRIPFAMSSMSNLAGEAVGQARAAVGIKSRAERKRDSIKGRIQVLGGGEMDGATDGLLVAGENDTGENERSKTKGGGKGKPERRWWEGSAEDEAREGAGYGLGGWWTAGSHDAAKVEGKGKGHGRGQSHSQAQSQRDVDQESRKGRQRAGTWSGRGKGRGGVLGDGPWL